MASSLSTILAMAMLLLTMVRVAAPSSLEDNALILLQLKALIMDPTGSLKSWTQERAAMLCTDWYGVTCDTSHTLITGINLSNKNLSGSLSPAVGSLMSLQILNLANNMLTGSLPVQIMGCTSLRTIDLSNNNFTGEIPSGFSKLINLESISLWTNSFIGPIPKDIVLCSKLQHLDLGGSYLEGEIPHAIGNLSNLVYLTLAGNEFTGEIPSSLKLLKRLEWIYLGYNQLSGSIPPELGEITSLKHLDLVHNSLSGEFPFSLTNLTNLQYLFLFDNQLSGTIPPAIANLTQLYSLDLSINTMMGSIPSGISNLQQLQILNLFSNNFTGEIPHSIAAMPNLQVLALWMNQLSGEVPARLGMENNLTMLDLSSNQLTGPIPDGICASGNLYKLILFTNFLSGRIPESLANCQSFQRVRLEGNLFSGTLPQALGNLPHVYYLDISSNNLSGKIDNFTWNMPALQALRLQRNHFTGTIPSTIGNSKGLVNIDLSQNALVGEIPSELGSLPQLNQLHLNGNMLSGVIQKDGLLMCKKLVSLDLSNNQLSGPIPSELASMPMLSTLVLSHNQFSGIIPSQLGEMESLVYVNLSFNHLTGEIPLSGAFIDINVSSIEGNPGLCGGSLGPCVSSTSHHAFASGSVKSRVTEVLFLIGLSMAMMGLCNVIWKLKHGEWGGKSLMKLRSMKSKAWGEWDLKLFHAVKPTVEEILEAMQEENVVEKRGPSIVYKSSTKMGVPFAAMELIIGYGKNDTSNINNGSDGFEAVLAAIGRERHPNILNVYGICCGVASSIMVFELVEGCRLSSLLHGFQGGAMDWEKRLNIAVGIAKAIVKLHSFCLPPIVHGSISSNNVMVCTGYVARLLPPSTAGAHLVIPSKGKDAGEVNPFAVDIYDFGVILLELVTGRPATELINGDVEEGMTGGSGGKAVVIDDRLRAGEVAEAALQVGMSLCGRRPSPSRSKVWHMREVLRVLEDLRRRQQRTAAGTDEARLQEVFVK